MMGLFYVDIQRGGYIYCRILNNRYGSRIVKPWKWHKRR